MTAMEGLEAMRRGKISPWVYQVKNTQGDLLLPPRYRDVGKSEKTERKINAPGGMERNGKWCGRWFGYPDNPDLKHFLFSAAGGEVTA